MSDYFYAFTKLKRDVRRMIQPDSKTDLFFICLDSCRYDVFTEAKTPNIESIGDLQRAYSFACFTPSSVLGYLMNFPPIGLNIGRIYPYKKWAWLPKELHKDGYNCAIYSANVILPLLNINLNGGFLKDFDVKEFLKYEGDSSVDGIVEDAINFFNGHKKTFVFMLLMETHTPMYNGRKVKTPYPLQRPSSIIEFQRDAVEFIDAKLGRLFEAIRLSGRKTDVIVTSDHGELNGVVNWGHNPGDLTFYNKSRIYYSEKLFEIPFIRGKIN
jgi:membrane-anchored protein YejM (alkaline phosphatase superfamily)